MRLTRLVFGLAIVAFPAFAQTPYSFRKTLDQVRQTNPVLRLQAMDVEATRSDEITAGLKSNPVLNNQTLLQLSSRHLPDGGGYLSARNRQFWLQLTKEFDLYGKRERKVRFAKGMTSLSENNLRETSRTVLRDAGLAWVDAWYASVRLDLLLQTQVNLDSLVLLNKVRLRNQVVTTTDLTRTELLAEQNSLQIRTARQNYANQLAQLKLQTGQTDSLQIDLSDPVLTPLLADSLLTFALNQRSDMQVARSGLEAADRNADLQQVLAKPRNEMGTIWNPQNAVPYLGIYLTFELPVFARNQGEIQKSRILQQQAQDLITFTQKRISTELRTALVTLHNHQNTIQKYQQILSQSDKVLASVRYAYLKGATTLVDYLEAQRFWFDTRQTYYDALYEYRKSFVEVLYTSGLISQW
ncbi:MAG: TolC family protein [Siphonobacter aquaeclarae]|nr:TolC family protein [Siphonobacter aquaeclarae]